MPPSNNNPDPGRIREEDLDKVPFTDKSNPIKYLKEKVTEADRGRKS